MPEVHPADITQLLIAWGNGDETAHSELLERVYDQLRLMASGFLRREGPGHTLQTTALVHEAYLRLVDQDRVIWRNRTHFFGIAGQMMRRILVDHARSLGYAKRGGGAKPVALDEAMGLPVETAPDVVALDDCLRRLAAIDGQQAKIVELRFFGGLSKEEIAEFLGISTATVSRRWRMARAWLHHHLNASDRHDP